jgi:cytoskeleton protein RodZ
MSEAEGSGRTSAGALLRAARERQGLHIAALAAAIKVTPRKLEALERDAYDELPDPTFTRALAQTVCRTLKIDAQPVLALLPHPEASMLDHVGGSLNTPFRQRASRDEPAGLAAAAVRPMVWAGVLLLLAAGIVYLLPGAWLQWPPGGAKETSVAARPAASVPAGTIVEPVFPPASAVIVADAQPPASAPAVAAASAPPAAVTAAPASAPPASTALVQLKAAGGASWVEARDAQGRILLSRTLQPGETAGVDGALPLKLTVGNARVTEVAFRGKPVDLTPFTRGIIARFELQ